MPEFPDWTRAVVLVGSDALGNPIAVLVDATGNINVLLRGLDATSALRTVKVDSLGQLYAVLRGAGGVDVAVDAAGQLTAILKGWYGGAYHTIAVDADGRLEAFVLDGEDQWGKVLRIGNSELAARLGSLKVYDWRGSVLWQTDFSRGIHSAGITESGAGADVSISPDYWRTGGYSLKLVGGSDSLRIAAVGFNGGAPPAARIGFEAHYSVAGVPESFQIEMTMDVGTVFYTSFVRFLCATGDLQLWGDDLAWHTFASVELPGDVGSFYPLKYVVNFATGAYVRALHNRVEYDLSAYQCQASAATGTRLLGCGVRCNSRAGQNDTIYVDRYLVTVSEPV